MSPALSAAMRVAGLETGVKMTSVRLCWGLSHQLGLLTSTVRSPARRSFSMKGPVPMALRVAKFSSFLVMSAEFWALFFSAHALDIMTMAAHLSASSGSGYLVVTTTRMSPSFLISFTDTKLLCMFEPGPLARFSENTMSSAVSGEPSWNFTPGRMSKNQVVGSDWPHLVASAGSSLRFLSRRISGS